MQNTTHSLENAYAECRRMATHYENFPVGSVLIPKALRHHFFALYAFMRTADDFADLPFRSAQERCALLDDWRSKLQSILDGREPEHPVFIALANTITERHLPTAPLFKLLEAFDFDAKGDVHFQTFDDLRWYTARSADPVGELVLALFGHKDQHLIALSNEICTGLQLLNFIQDIKEDLENERYYFPKDDWEVFQITPSSNPDINKLSLLSLFELKRVEAMIDRGSSLPELVGGRLGFELRAVIHSARRLIQKIQNTGGNSFQIRQTLTKRERLFVLLQSMLVRASNS